MDQHHRLTLTLLTIRERDSTDESRPSPIEPVIHGRN
jgi:hypothetical protein